MSSIYSYITEQESAFTREITLEEGWGWNFKDHVRRSFLYKNSQFLKNNIDRKRRPFKNIVRAILNIQYRTEGFDVKDIEIYVDNPETYYKSFLIKKYHDGWALRNEMDTFIDEVVESYVDYGGVLVKNVKGIRPEVVDLRTLAFCDQTNILSGPFAIKHYLSPEELRNMAEAGWGKAENGANITVEDMILLSEFSKRQNKENGKTDTPGRYIELYEIHNVSEMDINPLSKDSTPRIYICGLYKDREGKDQGVALFGAKEPKLPFKFLKRDPIQGRALGFGGVEELFEAQTWTNFSEIHIAGMLEHASKIFYKSTDPKFKNQNLSGHDNGKVFDITIGHDLGQIDNQPRNLAVFNDSCERWYEHARTMGAASEISLGQQPSAGTPFASLQEQVKQGNDLHVWRQGRIATFIDEIYRDWTIQSMVKEMIKGSKFLSELSMEEMMMVIDRMITNIANEKIVQMVLQGGKPSPEETDLFKQIVREELTKGGNKRFFEILKDEMSEEKLNVKTNIAGKQKNLALLTDKVVNILRQFMATPQIRQDPEMVKLTNVVLESSGLSPMMFNPMPIVSPMQPQQLQGGTTSPLKDLSQNQLQPK